jgi:hypothetical protein
MCWLSKACTVVVWSEGRLHVLGPQSHVLSRRQVYCCLFDFVVRNDESIQLSYSGLLRFVGTMYSIVFIGVLERVP